ncbi:unnamed protein product [Amoebophrya sp. A120]|nr:unnamed protein product [Amoebophrya sp. A120]|eukprot:GSA120T00006856001.1
MVMLEVSALHAVKPIFIAGAGTLILNRSGVDLATLPVIGPLLGDDNTSILQKHNGKDQHGGHASNTSPDDEKMLSTAQYFLCFLPGNKMLKKRGNMINSACGMSGRNSASDNYREDGATGGASHNHPLHSKNDDDDAFSSDDPPDHQRWLVTGILKGMGAVDILLGAVLLKSMYLPIDQPLKLWLAGAIALGFPTSILVSRVAEKFGFRQAFLVETMANTMSAAWLSWGMMMASKTTAFKTAPLLFWTVYIACVTSWSVIGTSMLGLVLTTVVAILFGKKRPPAVGA